MKYIIFTDLDETLLDRDTYDFKEAEDSLSLIKERNYPLIFVTSKTRSELIPLSKKIDGRDNPFVVENGGGVFFLDRNFNFSNDNLDIIDNYSVKIFGKKYSEIRNIFNRLRKIALIKGFGDMDEVEISRLTKLPVKKAKLAKKRDFTEPFIFEKGEEKKIKTLEKEAEKLGAKIVKGGKFYHLIGKGQDKGKAVRFLIELYKKEYKDIKSIGLGDSENDIEFLREVDIPVLIRKKDGNFLSVKLKNMVVSDLPSTKGWNDTILRLLK